MKILDSFSSFIYVRLIATVLLTVWGIYVFANTGAIGLLLMAIVAIIIQIGLMIAAKNKTKEL